MPPEPPKPPKKEEKKEAEPKVPSKPITGAKLWVMIIIIALIAFPTFNFFYNRSIGDPITIGTLFYPAYMENMVGSISSTAGRTYRSVTQTTPKPTTPTTTPEPEVEKKGWIARTAGSRTSVTIIAIILVLSMIYGGKKLSKKLRKRDEEEGPPGEGPPPSKSPDRFDPKEYGEAIDYLIEKHPAAVLISGRALKTAVEQAHVFQHHSPTPLESIGMLLGFPNVHFEGENELGIVVPFYIPLPIEVAVTGERTPEGIQSYAIYHTELLDEIEKIAKGEFSGKAKSELANMYKDLKNTFDSYEARFGPNEVLNKIRGEELFDIEIRKHFKRLGFEELQDQLSFVGHFHNHVWHEGIPKGELLIPSQDDLNNNCSLRARFNGRATADLLIATQVNAEDKDTVIKNYKGDSVGIKFWHSTECGVGADGKMRAKEKKVSPVDFLIFCMDKKMYKWWTKNAPKLDEQDRIIDWCGEYDKLAKEKKKPKKKEPTDPIDKILAYLAEINRRKEYVIHYIDRLEKQKKDVTSHLHTLHKEIMGKGEDSLRLKYFMDNVAPFLRDPRSKPFRELTKEKKGARKLILANMGLFRILEVLSNLEDHLNKSEKQIKDFVQKSGLDEPEINAQLEAINQASSQVAQKLNELFRIEEQETKTTQEVKELLSDEYIEKRIYNIWVGKVVRDEKYFEQLIKKEFTEYSKVIELLKKQIQAIEKLIEKLKEQAKIKFKIGSPRPGTPVYIRETVALETEGIPAEEIKNYKVIWQIKNEQGTTEQIYDYPKGDSIHLSENLLPQGLTQIPGTITATLTKEDQPEFQREATVSVVITERAIGTKPKPTGPKTITPEATPIQPTTKPKEPRSVIVPKQLMAEILSDCKKEGATQEVGFMLAGFYNGEHDALVITDHRKIKKGTRTSILADSGKVRFVMTSLLTHLTEYDKQLKVDENLMKSVKLYKDWIDVNFLAQKNILGGIHTHPAGIALSPDDLRSIREFIEYAKKHPVIFEPNLGNLEIVYDSQNGEYRAYYVSESSYNEVKIKLI